MSNKEIQTEIDKVLEDGIADGRIESFVKNGEVYYKLTSLGKDFWAKQMLEQAEPPKKPEDVQ